MNDFLEYREFVLEKLNKIGLILIESKKINYGEIFELESSSITLKISLYYNKKNQFKFVINKIIPEHKKEFIYNTLIQVSPIVEKETNNELLNNISSLDFNKFNYAGSDESGKGDYFGSLVVVAFTCKNEDIAKLIKYGVKDSKLLSDEKIIILAEKILLEFRGQYEYMVLMPEKYNELYAKFSVNKPGLNEMLAWMHSKVIGNLHKRQPFQRVIIDKFANEKLIKYYVNKECSAELNIITKAESETIVAVASIIARYLFIKKLQELSTKYQIKLLKGASLKVKDLKNSINPDILPFVCKMHFK